MAGQHAVTADDIATLRQQGDLEGFLQALTGRARAHRPAAAPQDAPAPPRSRPGAWPAGCQRPGPPSPIPEAVVRAAVDDYRAWVAAGSPDGPVHCDCTPCRHHQNQESR